MKNGYRVEGGAAYIQLERRGPGPRLEAIVDLADLERVAAHEGSWYASYRKQHAGSYFCLGNRVGEDGQRRAFYLHRYLLGAGPEEVIESVNGNGLDCRRANLKRTPRRAAHRRISGPNANNQSSRLLGVTWDGHAGKWKAQLTIDGVKRHLGLFTDKEAAAAAVAAARDRSTPRAAAPPADRPGVASGA